MVIKVKKKTGRWTRTALVANIVWSESKVFITMPDGYLMQSILNTEQHIITGIANCCVTLGILILGVGGGGRGTV